LNLSHMARKVVFSLIPGILCFWVWVQDGVRLSLWKTSVGEKKEIPLVEGMPELGTQTQIIWRDQFVCGIETPVLGLIFTAVLLFTFCLKRKKS